MSAKKEFILIDGYNKSVFYNAFKKYLKKKKKDIKEDNQYILIDIDNYFYYEPDLASNFVPEKIIDKYKFRKKILKCLNETPKYIFIFSTSRLKKEIQFKDNNIKIDFIYYTLLKIKDENKEDVKIEQYFLEKENNDFISMNDFLCTIRIYDIQSFTNYFMPFGGFILFNYLECQEINKYYQNDIYQTFDKYQFEDLFHHFIHSKINIHFDRSLMKYYVKSHLNNSKIRWIGIILMIFIIRLVFYLPYYIFFIKKIKNKQIKIKNKLFLIIILLLPLSTFIIPTFCILFIPEIINLFCFIKLMKEPLYL